MNGELTLSISTKGKITPTFPLQAGAVEALTIEGAFSTGHLYRLTIKPKSGWSAPTWVITLTAFTVTSTALTASLNLNSADLISYLGSTTKVVALEVWDDTDNSPVGRKTDILCDPPVQREDDVPDQAQPVRTLTNDQIQDLFASKTGNIAATELTSPQPEDRFSTWRYVVDEWLPRWFSFTGLRTLLDAAYALLGHTHSGTTDGVKLSQANTHESVDTDDAVGSLHHTIGTGATQATPGTHAGAAVSTSHSGIQAPTAENDFLVGDPAPFGSWVRKTLAQVKTLLNLGSAASAATTDFSPAGAIPSTEKGAANGVAPLASDAKISTAYLPAAALGALSYQGTWNALTNSPAIPAAASGNKGWYYMVATAGTTAIDGISDWVIGDWIVSNGTTWNKIDNTDAVSSVAGLTGVISSADLLAVMGAIAIADGNIDGGTDDVSFMDPVFDIDCGVF